jgi:uncharacterized membrane protein
MSQFPPQQPPPPPPPPPGGGMPVGGGGNQPAEAGAAISYGWKKFQEHWQSIVLAIVVGFVVLAVLGVIGFFVQNAITDNGECTVRITNDGVVRSSGCGSVSWFTRMLAYGVFQFLIWVGVALLQLFIIRATLLLVRGRPVDAQSVMTTDKLGRYIVGAIIVAVLTFVGFILCFIPGLIVWFLTLFWGYFLVDKDMQPIDAITASFNLVKDNVGPVLLFLLLSWVVLFVGALICGIGLIVAWPVVIIATGYMYMRLQGEPVAA